jgi:uncharacterized protein (DUF885 family)
LEGEQEDCVSLLLFTHRHDPWFPAPVEITLSQGEPLRSNHALRRTLLALIFYLVASPCISKTHARAGQVSVENRRRQLRALFDEEWEYELRTQPEFATTLGDKRYNDRLSDYSVDFYQSDVEEKRKFLARFEAIDPSGLDDQDTLSITLMIRDLRQQIEGAQFKSWEMPVNQMGGPHLELADLASNSPFDTVADFDNYIARLRQIPRVFNQTIANLRQGMKDGYMPPKYLLEKAAAETDDLAGKSGEASPFANPVKEFPEAIPAVDQKRLRESVLAEINELIVPAYKQFAAFLHTEYVPKGRAEPGVWVLPDGAARYRYSVRRMTTTDRIPNEIYEIGLKQIAETEAEMLALARQLGFKDLANLNEHVKSERTFYAKSGQQIFDLYAKYSLEMGVELPKLFGRLPRSKLVVVPMEPARSKNAVPADYSIGTADGSRPGRINVNKWDPEHRLLLNVEAIAYHEGVPGHHLQLSLAQELRDLPAFRRHGGYTAFVEGWALYSERLGREVGRYQDPYSEYGRLENEMWRAIRLVIDTGVHEKKWSREQMVEYFHRYTAMDEPNVQSEVDRYIAWPGQALAYKLGQLEILKLRDEARQKLGVKFDLRSFHDEVLGNGALPLDVLDTQVRAWIKHQEQS